MIQLSFLLFANVKWRWHDLGEIIAYIIYIYIYIYTEWRYLKRYKLLSLKVCVESKIHSDHFCGFDGDIK